MRKEITILWKQPEVSGTIELKNGGMLAQLSAQTGAASFHTGDGRITLAIDDAKLTEGSFATLVTVRTEKPFTFFLRDVRGDMPIWIAPYGVCVTTAEDLRGYDELVDSIRARGRRSKIMQMENEPEESFRAAAAHNRNMPCVTWLGLSRDVRLFEVRPHTLSNPGDPWDVFQPMLHHTPVTIPEMGDKQIQYDYFAGRGIGCRQDMTRRLEEGVLPILNIRSDDGEISYRQKLFVTTERTRLTEQTLHGTHYLVADLFAKSPTPRTPEQQALTDELYDAEMEREDEAVLYLRVDAVNTSDAPKYAYMRIPQPNVSVISEMSCYTIELDDEGLDSYTETGRVFMTASLNGKPVTDVEYAVLLGAGERARFEFRIPHRPIPRQRALKLAQCDFDEKLAECTAFWRAKLARIAQIHLPERRIEEMMKAGYLHLDLVCFGNEPDDAVAPVVGVYTPIGTESTPIIQYFESLGDQELARRAITYFLKKQRSDGFMQNFSNYMSETGLGLWNAAEHYRFTRDEQWLRSIAGNLVRGCDYIREWTLQSMDRSLLRRGYGMIFGKVGDCEYPFHSYMLNSTTWAGVRSCAEVLTEIGDPNAPRIVGFANEYRANILQSLEESFAVAPVIPLADGSWCPAIAQWPEINGPMCLFANGGKTFSHGMMVECSENGCYDILYGLLPPDSDFATFTIQAVTELINLENTSFSQPYYSVHPLVHLLRGETRSFLKEFYNNVSALADRETYTFWEHQYQESPHKTHEEAWFLMRCRWMLFMDQCGRLELLRGVPRAWLGDGKTISYRNMATRFGRLSVEVRSALCSGTITADITLAPLEGAAPDAITIRLPHPDGLRPAAVHGGKYCAETETVTLPTLCGTAQVVLEF